MDQSVGHPAHSQIRVRPAACRSWRSLRSFDFEDQKIAAAAEGPAGRGSAGKPSFICFFGILNDS